MKSIISTIIVIALLATLAACGGMSGSSSESAAISSTPEPAPEVSFETNEPTPAPQVTGNPVDYEAVAAVLNRVLEEKGRDEVERFGHISNSFYYADYDTVTVYHTTTLNGYNVILLYLKTSGDYQVMEMGDVGLYTIQSIAPLQENPDVIRIYAESRVFGGDYIFLNFPSAIFYSISQGKVTAVRYDPDEPGVYGMVGTRDWQQFSECTVDDKSATFSFKMIEGGDGNGYDGAEIEVRNARRYESDKPSIIGFRNTELNLSEDFITKVQAMEGVASAKFEYIQTEIFTGTQLIIQPKPDYRIACSMDSGFVGQPRDFTIRYVRKRYDEPDFTDALGFKVILQNGPPMIDGELYGSDVADMAFQLDKTNIAHLRVAEYTGESVDAYNPRWYEFETEKEIDINGISVNIRWNMSGPMSATWSKNGYAFNFYMNEEETELAEESFLNFVEWAVRDIVLEPAIVTNK